MLKELFISLSEFKLKLTSRILTSRGYKYAPVPTPALYVVITLVSVVGLDLDVSSPGAAAG